MDESEKKKRNVNPRQEAGLLSKITFFFVYTTFQLGLRKDIEVNDVYEIVKTCRSLELGNVLERLWEQEKFRSNPHILRPITRLFGIKYAANGLALMFIWTGILVLKPILIGKIVSYFTPNQHVMSRDDVLLYSLALLGCFLLNTIFIHTYFFNIEQLCLRIKTAVCSLIYRKSLKLNSNFSANNPQGLAINLMTKDIMTFDFAVSFLNHSIVGVFQVIVMCYIMYRQIGVSALAGSSVILIFIPVQAFLAYCVSKVKLKTVKKTDARLQLTQELLTAMRIVKMYTWEIFFGRTINELRKKEIHNLRILFFIKTMGFSLGHMSTKIAMYLCVVVYIALGFQINAEKIFVVKGCFEVLTIIVMIYIPIGLFMMAEFLTCLDRINNYLLLDEIVPLPEMCSITNTPSIVLKDVSLKLPETNTTILNNLSLKIYQKGLTIVLGAVGSGKSTLLKVILNDVRITSGDVQTNGNLSYSSQEPWLFPSTIRKNIIFNEVFDEERYDTVIKVCNLSKDFSMFPHHDLTSVSDRGLNLSRGQKARITLARAVYKTADIYLLDDCLSAVDGNVAKRIFRDCIKGFLKDKITVLVTYQDWCFSSADEIVVLGGGTLKYQGKQDGFRRFSELNFGYGREETANEADLTYKKWVENKEENFEIDENENETDALIPTQPISGKNVYEEEKEEGSVNKHVYFTYFTSGGGVKMIIIVAFFCIIAQIMMGLSEYFITTWVDTEQKLSAMKLNGTTNTTEFVTVQESRNNMVMQYTFVILGAVILSTTKSFVFFFYTCKISVNLHKKMLGKILNATMTFFDTNLLGNIINRFSRDLNLLDEMMPFISFDLSISVLILLTILALVSLVNTIFLIPSIAIALIFLIARRIYLPTGRSLMRLQGTTRSAVVGHLNSTLEGLTTIRASQAQIILQKEFDKHLDLNNSVGYMSFSTSRAFQFYTELLSTIYIATILLTFIFFNSDVLAGQVGLALTQSLGLTAILQWTIKEWAELENQMTCAERVIEYTKIEEEEKSGISIMNWPSNGKIEYRNVNLRYLTTEERVLKNVTFTILPLQKIGIVGRTGAGKSSIISTLFRLYEFRGTILIDDKDISCVAVEYLRSKISVIPQDPVLFSGTIRSNLDPKNKFLDKDVWKALEEVKMTKLIEGLDLSVKEGGANFSIGQRQLICLARAILRNNKILVLDEATANVDPRTDELIQSTIKRVFKNCTVITIAHRLHTIMDCDRIIVMEAGSVIEFDHPNVLTQNKQGLFYKMVRDAGLMM